MFDFGKYKMDAQQAMIVRQVFTYVDMAFSQATDFCNTRDEIPSCQLKVVLYAVVRHLKDLADMAERDGRMAEVAERAAYAKNLVEGVINDLNSKNMHI